jgi:hemerythrin-like domain-containing protein
MDMERAERPLLFDTPAGFDDPLEMLLGCHRRIERQLETLRRLREHLDRNGVDADASGAARAVLDYFGRAAIHHHQDEEADLLPMLEARIGEAGEASRFKEFRAALERDHRALEDAWARLRKPLEGIAEGLNRSLAARDVNAFALAYLDHIRFEEATIKALFERWLGEADRRALGLAVSARRSAPRS